MLPFRSCAAAYERLFFSTSDSAALEFRVRVATTWDWQSLDKKSDVTEWVGVTVSLPQVGSENTDDDETSPPPPEYLH